MDYANPGGLGEVGTEGSVQSHFRTSACMGGTKVDMPESTRDSIAVLTLAAAAN